MPSPRSEASIKAARTRRRKQIEERAKHRRENYEIHDAEEFLCRYPAEGYSLDEVLDCCAEIVSDEECSVPSVVVWLADELVGAAKRDDDGVTVVTAFHGLYAGSRRVLLK
jgi:hypothetical protein